MGVNHQKHALAPAVLFVWFVLSLLAFVLLLTQCEQGGTSEKNMTCLLNPAPIVASISGVYPVHFAKKGVKSKQGPLLNGLSPKFESQQLAAMSPLHNRIKKRATKTYIKTSQCFSWDLI